MGDIDHEGGVEKKMGREGKAWGVWVRRGRKGWRRGSLLRPVAWQPPESCRGRVREGMQRGLQSVLLLLMVFQIWK